ncbi:MAG: sulfurtransferase-like selenium metabolism protein YedF [Deltaproteobacteria bacterium]|nr:sulfurtransferase-like selenium metabolism protein YedF [Deltaproteobacteria bacterium]MBW2153780.1 sulfurtransferase-like selenium metabolism protein YedF [Deltaproteobacteria bacterium]
MKEIDARGLACPAPVLKTRAALQEQEPHSLRVVVDSASAQQSVQRFLESKGFHTKLDQNGTGYLVFGTRGSIPEEQSEPSGKRNAEDLKKIMVICSTDRIGFGDEALGVKLMINFLRTVKEMGNELWRLVFLNNGVKLTIDGSEALDDLKEYEKGGLKILVCGTCLNHFNLLERKQVGETTNMLDIVTSMQVADKVIFI